MSHRRFGSGRRQNPADMDLNITPFMNLMVVLIPFLLSGIVFSRLAVLEMSLPTTQSESRASQVEKTPFQLIVTLRGKSLTVQGSDVGRVVFPSKKEGYDLDELVGFLLSVKARYPGEKSVILLSEPEIPYALLVEVMDACREHGETVLFPEISVGEVKVI